MLNCHLLTTSNVGDNEMLQDDFSYTFSIVANALGKGYEAQNTIE